MWLIFLGNKNRDGLPPGPPTKHRGVVARWAGAGAGPMMAPWDAVRKFEILINYDYIRYDIIRNEILRNEKSIQIWYSR